VVLEQILFFVAATFALAGALGIVLFKNPFYSVLALVCHLIALATLFLLLQAQFLAAAQVVVYAGAVMVLYVFVVAYVGGAEEPLSKAHIALARFGPLFAGAVLLEVAFAMLGSGLSALDGQGARLGPGFGTPGQIGSLLLQRFLLAFELASILLLVAAVGAVVLARRRRGLEDQTPVGPTIETEQNGDQAELTTQALRQAERQVSSATPEREQ
jgi:NADH-quinone oxidoreductase subunit J